MTRHFIPTGITVDDTVLKSPVNIIGTHLVGCPYCHGVHFWRTEDVVLESLLPTSPHAQTGHVRGSDLL